MIVVGDTSPLHYLILLEHAEVLQKLYGCVIIPEAVVRELQAQKAPAVVRLWITTPPEWLQPRQIAVPPDPGLTELDPGEREAIALAKALRADALLIREKAGGRELERRRRPWTREGFGRFGRGMMVSPAGHTLALAGIRILPRQQAPAISA